MAQGLGLMQPSPEDADSRASGSLEELPPPHYTPRSAPRPGSSAGEWVWFLQTALWRPCQLLSLPTAWAPLTAEACGLRGGGCAPSPASSTGPSSEAVGHPLSSWDHHLLPSGHPGPAPLTLLGTALSPLAHPGGASAAMTKNHRRQTFIFSQI